MDGSRMKDGEEGLEYGHGKGKRSPNQSGSLRIAPDVFYNKMRY